MPRINPKDYVFSLRIRKELVDEIENVASKENMSKSDYIRKAISDAITLTGMNRQMGLYLVTPEMLKFSLDFMPDAAIKTYAGLALQNGRQFLKGYLKKNINSTIVTKYLADKKFALLSLVNYIAQHILGPTGQNWFQRIRSSWERDYLAITGRHTLGEKFSKFIQFYFIQFFEIFGYTEVAGNAVINKDIIKVIFHEENAKGQSMEEIIHLMMI